MSFYERYGKAGLKERKNRSYDVEFKLTVLQVIDEEFLSLRVACVHFNIPSESIILNWQRMYRLNGRKGLEARKKGRPAKMKLPNKRMARKSNKPLSPEQELLRENEYLKAENALLKKLHALVQAEQKRKP